MNWSSNLVLGMKNRFKINALVIRRTVLQDFQFWLFTRQCKAIANQRKLSGP